MICTLKTQTNEKCEKLNTMNKYNKYILVESLNKQKVNEDDYISVNDLRQSDIDILEILFDNDIIMLIIISYFIKRNVWSSLKIFEN